MNPRCGNQPVGARGLAEKRSPRRFPQLKKLKRPHFSISLIDCHPFRGLSSMPKFWGPQREWRITTTSSFDRACCRRHPGAFSSPPLGAGSGSSPRSKKKEYPAGYSPLPLPRGGLGFQAGASCPSPPARLHLLPAPSWRLFLASARRRLRFKSPI